MPRKEMNFENAIIYKLCCNDITISDTYIGSTLNFKQRKYDHKSCCTNEKGSRYNLLVYSFIREHGGWNNWSMIEIQKCPDVKDNLELKKLERKYIEELKATLNRYVPSRTENEWKESNIDIINEKQREYYQQNKASRLEKAKSYRQENRDRINEQTKIRRQERGDEYKEKRKIIQRRYYEKKRQEKMQKESQIE